MEWLDPVFRWLAAAPLRYWALAWGGVGLATLLALAPELGAARPWARRFCHPAWFAGAVLLACLALRWPTWFAGPQPNPDEAHMLAGAITLREHPVFWRDVDGTTHGPLNDYLLLPVAWFGLPLDLASQRLTGTLLVAGALLATWLAARAWLDDSSARLALLPALVFWGGTSFWDFFQYSSELMPLVLIAAGGAWGAWARRAVLPWQRRGGLAAAATLLGLVPFAKLQALPLAAAVGALLLGAVLCFPPPGAERARRAEATWLVGAALAPSLILFVLLAASGLWPEFFQSYLRSNLVYTGARHATWGEQLRDWGNFLGAAPGSGPFFWGTLWGSLGLSLVGIGRGGRLAGVAAGGWAVALAAFFTVLAPGRGYMHYLHFLAPSGAFLLACGLHAARGSLQPISPWLARGVMLAGVIAVLHPQIAFRRSEDHPFVRGYAGTRPALSPVAARIRGESRPGDRLAIWGWRPLLYVETGLPQGTRDGQTQRMIEAGPMAAFYRERFLAGFVRTRPRWFVDAVGPGNFAYENRPAQDHATFGELARVVRADYELLDDLGGCRIYRRKADP